MSIDHCDEVGWPAEATRAHPTEVNPGRKAELFPLRYSTPVSGVAPVPRVVPRAPVQKSWEELLEERRRYG